MNPSKKESSPSLLTCLSRPPAALPIVPVLISANVPVSPSEIFQIKWDSSNSPFDLSWILFYYKYQISFKIIRIFNWWIVYSSPDMTVCLRLPEAKLGYQRNIQKKIILIYISQFLPKNCLFFFWFISFQLGWFCCFKVFFLIVGCLLACLCFY
jgi:hypothetical protein